MQTLHSFSQPNLFGSGPTLLSHLKGRLDKILGPKDSPTDPREIFASATAGAGTNIGKFDEINDLVKSSIIYGFRSVHNSTDGWTVKTSLPNYKQAEIATVEFPSRLTPIGSGGTAAHFKFALTSPQGWRLAKFGAKFQIDERDVIDGLQLEPLLVALEEIGAAAARLAPDLVYSLLFNNAALADGTALFHANRNNLATGGGSALSSTSLATAYGALAARTANDQEGAPIHLNLSPRYLIVSPSLGMTAKNLVHDRLTGQDDIIVRTESRISTTGVFDPLAEEVITSLNTSWLLAAPADQAHSVIVGTLDGMTQPMIRSGPLDGGKWGQWFDVSYSVGVTAATSYGLYWSNGA